MAMGTEYGDVTKVVISPHFPLEFPDALFGLAYKPSFKRYFMKCQLIHPFQEQKEKSISKKFYGIF